MALKKIWNKTVATSGTRVQLVTSATKVSWFLAQVLRTNTGKIMIGDATVTTSGTAGITLEIPQASQTLPYIQVPPVSSGGPNPIELSEYYIDATVSGEGVNVIYDEV